MEIYLYEIKKLFCKRSFKLTILVLIIYISVMMVFKIKDSAQYVQLDGSSIYGFGAISQLKDDQIKYSGKLTDEKLMKVIEENRKINHTKEFLSNESGYVGLNDKGYSKTQGFQGIRDLLNSSFVGFDEYNYFKADSLRKNDAKFFYTNRINKLRNWLEDKDFTTLEKNYLIQAEKSLQKPFTYTYMKGWDILIEFLSVVLYAVIIVVCIVSAQVFGNEYQNDSNGIFLTTKYGKNKGISMKILSGLTMSSVIYWSILLIFSFIILCIFGFEGGNCEIQSNWSFWKCFYHINNIQGTLMILLLGYMGCLFMSVFTMFFSIKMKSSFGSIIISFVVIMAPAILGETTKNPTIEKLVEVFPHQMLMGEKILTRYNFIDLGSKVLNPYEYLTLIYIIFSLIAIFLSYKSFKKQQIS